MDKDMGRGMDMTNLRARGVRGLLIGIDIVPVAAVKLAVNLVEHDISNPGVELGFGAPLSAAGEAL